MRLCKEGFIALPFAKKRMIDTEIEIDNMARRNFGCRCYRYGTKTTREIVTRTHASSHIHRHTRKQTHSREAKPRHTHAQDKPWFGSCYINILLLHTHTPMRECGLGVGKRGTRRDNKTYMEKEVPQSIPHTTVSDIRTLFNHYHWIVRSGCCEWLW